MAHRKDRLRCDVGKPVDEWTGKVRQLCGDSQDGFELRPVALGQVSVFARAEAGALAPGYFFLDGGEDLSGSAVLTLVGLSAMRETKDDEL